MRRGCGMSNGVPRWTPEMLDAYNRRLEASRAKGATIHLPTVKLPGKKPEYKPAPASKFDAMVVVDPKLLAQGGVQVADIGHVPHRPKQRARVPVRAAEGKQSKTEIKYNREVLGGRGRFEPVSLRLPGGGRYTPDFMTIEDGTVTFHEVKGSYRLGSQGRAYTAFHDAAAYYPMWRFVWAHWDGKRWDCSTIPEIRKSEFDGESKYDGLHT